MSRTDTPPLKTGDTIGIIGGGQLGRMLAMAAARFSLKTIVLEPGKNCPAAQLANHHIQAEYDDVAALKEMVASCKLITYEFENIPLETVSFLEENNTLYPNSLALQKSQDRLVEKTFLNSIDIQTAPYQNIETIGDLEEAYHRYEQSGILKTRRFGYDGKGQVRLEKGMNNSTLQAALDETTNAPCVLEGLINFQCEISTIVARSTSGEIAVFDPAENVHKDGILRTSIVPANVSGQIIKNAKSIAARIVDALDYVGVMGVEFFVLENDDLIVNEIAPRVHNSGHWTEAACAVSQFEQHIRAIAGWPLGSTKRHSDCTMENLIGSDIERIPEIMSHSNTLLHLYGKEDSREGRKMGHFTTIKPL